MKQRSKVIATSIATIAMCASLAVGGTFALFTSESEVNIAVTSGTVDVIANVNAQSLKTYSMEKVQEAGKFENGGTAEFNAESQLELSLMTPGDKAEFTVDIANNSNVAIQYKVTFDVAGELADALVCSATNAENKWIYAEAGKAIDSVDVSVELPESVNNDYQSKGNTTVSVKVEAVQGNVQFVDEWDGTASIDWFLADPEATEFKLNTAEDLAGLAALVDGTATIPANDQIIIPDTFDGTFKGVTFTLNSDVDLDLKDENGNPVLFDPIGDGSHDFSGIFDGAGHTIYNLRQDCNAQHVGLFGAVYEGTVKNLTIDGALIENNGNGYAAIIAAYAGASTFENITLRNATAVNYNHNTGGIVGWCSNNGTTTTFDNINIESTTTIGSWWGSYDTRVGGIVGAMNTGNNVVIKNSTVACRLDVYNDVTSNYQWHNYRTAGMLIADVRDNKTVDGRTQANPARVTCENVTVIFGDWANYHYCESASYGTPSYADEGEYKFQRVEAGLGYGGVDTSACNHAEDESHNELIQFNFLFGARDGKGIYGISEFNGVEVIYNNK